jgi:hypothetical protein
MRFEPFYQLKTIGVPLTDFRDSAQLSNHTLASSFNFLQEVRLCLRNYVGEFIPYMLQLELSLPF